MFVSQEKGNYKTTTSASDKLKPLQLFTVYTVGQTIINTYILIYSFTKHVNTHFVNFVDM